MLYGVVRRASGNLQILQQVVDLLGISNSAHFRAAITKTGYLP
jgi:hypothetical protein